MATATLRGHSSPSAVRVKRGPFTRRREMSKADICNVAPVTNAELVDAIRMIVFAEPLDLFDDSTRWTITEGGEAC